MEITATIGKKRYAADINAPHDISIPVRFDGTSLSAFGAPPAHRDAYTTEGFIGDVKKGGSCNCDSLHFSAHLHGTHTECVGHIVSDTVHVHDVVKEGLIPVTLISVTPDNKSAETYIPKRHADDVLITKESLVQALSASNADFLEALIIRTLPNTADKITRNYGAPMPPYFSTEAMHYIVSLGITHLLVDTPSIDRMSDEGKLSNHHLFWGVKQGTQSVDKNNISLKSVTELIYISPAITDGNYLLNLQVAPLATDAAPSRPLLYEVKAA